MRSAALRRTAKTASGDLKYIRVERLGRVTIYKRGPTYWLYYREKGRTVRVRISGNLAVARATASKVNGALEESRPSPFGFERLGIRECVAAVLDYCENVQGLAIRTLDRYRAALNHFVEFTAARKGLKTVDQVSEVTVEEFVKFMRSKTRTRNGAGKGDKRTYKVKGIKFILSVCRTAFNYAKKRRHLAPYQDNPFCSFPIDKLKERDQEPIAMLTPEEQQRFFAECNDWQFGIFLFLAIYGLRVGELTHLLISDVDLDNNVFHIRSKPDLFWFVKTNRERSLPILPELKPFLIKRIGDRKAGFLFQNDDFFSGRRKAKRSFASPKDLLLHLRKIADGKRHEGVASEKELRKAVMPFLAEMGRIPEKRVRQELMKLTKKIGRPDVTKAHSLRHAFSTLAQEKGINPLVVQDILGHATLDMTRRYTHTGPAAKAEALEKFIRSDEALRGILASRVGGVALETEEPDDEHDAKADRTKHGLGREG